MRRLPILIAAAFVLATLPAEAGSGSFSGASGHKTSGSVSVRKSGGKLKITLGGSFSLDGAPDPYVALGNGSRPAKGGLISRLRKNKGSQSYSAPASASLENAGQVIIWCKKFGVPLGVADIQ